MNAGRNPKAPPQWPVRRPPRPNAPTRTGHSPNGSLQPIEVGKPETPSLALGICEGERLQFECSG